MISQASKKIAANVAALAACMIPLLAASVAADAFQPQPGWECAASVPQFQGVITEARFVAKRGEQPYYQIRIMKAIQGGAPKIWIFGNVPEVESARSYRYSTANGDTSLELLIQKFEDSDQGLKSALKFTGLSDVVPMECGRTR